MKNFSFVKHAKKFLILSIAILVLGVVVGVFTGGLNLGLDFTGGSLLSVNIGSTFEVAPIQNALSDIGEKGFTVLKTTQSGSQEQTVAQLRLRTKATDAQDRAQRDAILKQIQKTYPAATIGGVERVGAVASATMVKNALLSVLAAWVLILIYVSIRFQFHSALAAILCLINDVLVMIAVVTILRVEINSSFIAAVLTIIGYSINNTIVVFDRVRNDKKDEPNKSFPELVDQATRETFTRSMYTFLTTIITIGALFIFGSPSIREFALPIIVGLLAGAYSSLFLAGPIWVWMDKNSKPKPAGKKRIAARA